MQQKKIDLQIESKEKLQFKMVKLQFVPYFVKMVNLNGNILVKAGKCQCQIFDIIAGKMIASLVEVKGWVYSMASNKFGDNVAINYGGNARIIHIPTRKSQTLIGHPAQVIRLLFDPHSQFVAICSDDATARLYDAQTGKQIQIYQGDNKTILNLHFNPCSDKLITCSFDNTARIWDVRSGHCIHILDDHKDYILCSKFDFTGDYCATGSMDKTCKIWDVQTGKCIQTLTGHTKSIKNLSFNINGTRILTFSDDNTGRVYNLKTGECIAQVPDFQFYDLCCQPKSLILGGKKDSNPRIYSEKGEFLQSLSNCNGFNLCYFPNFDWIIVAFDNGQKASKLKFWKQVQK